MPAGARYRAPAVFVTPGTALHRRLPRHEAVQHSQDLAFPPRCRIRVRSNSMRAPHLTPQASLSTHAPRTIPARPSWPRIVGTRTACPPGHKSGSWGPRFAYPRIAAPPRTALPPRTAPMSPGGRWYPSRPERDSRLPSLLLPGHMSRQQARATGHGSMSGTQDHQARPGQAPRPRQLELIGIASGLVNGMVFVTMTCVRCAKDFSTTIGEICVTVARSPTRRRGGGTPDDRARQSHGSAAPASR
jgi:hypothetical protein